ncbi:MAG: hypothetical protein WEA84_14660 [Rhodovibrionaceae bacterium]
MQAHNLAIKEDSPVTAADRRWLSDKEIAPHDRLILALDTPSVDEAK